MKLLYSLTSPYARKVRIVAAEKRIAIDLEQVVLADPDCPVPLIWVLGAICLKHSCTHGMPQMMAGSRTMTVASAC